MIRQDRIVGADLSVAHPGERSYPTDSFYVQVANSLLTGFRQARIDLGDKTPQIMRYAAVSLASYLEDIVADSGQWRTFSDLCQQMFGWPVPMYHDDEEEYYPDEPSKMAIHYLIWNAATEMDDIWWKPELPQFYHMGLIAYRVLDMAFEQAPVNDRLKADIDSLLKKAADGFLDMRLSLIWMYSNCYITRSGAAEKLLQEELDSAKDTLPKESMRQHYAIMSCIFTYKTGPLALYAKDYVAALMRTRSMAALADEVKAIEKLPVATYKYTISADGNTLFLERTDGMKLELARDEITLSDKQLREFDGCMSVFVSYQGAWHMNGILMPIPDIGSRWEQMKKKDPNYMPDGLVRADGAWYLERTGGRQLLFFDDTEKLGTYMKKHGIMAPGQMEDIQSRIPHDTPVMMFIDPDDPQGYLQLSHGFNPSIDAPDNPHYDAATARQEAVEMLWNDDSIGTGAILYMLDHGYLHDLLDDDLICQNGGEGYKDSDARFLLRYMRRDKY